MLNIIMGFVFVNVYIVCCDLNVGGGDFMNIPLLLLSSHHSST